MLKFLSRYAVKAVVYFGVLCLFKWIGLLDHAPFALFAPALILAAVNTLLRPILVLIALPFNLVTFGIASVFANLLSLVVANAISGGALAAAFWIMLLMALAVMLADDGIRALRMAVRLKRADADA